jgi:hypothetical protein
MNFYIGGRSFKIIFGTIGWYSSMRSYRYHSMKILSEAQDLLFMLA